MTGDGRFPSAFYYECYIKEHSSKMPLSAVNTAETAIVTSYKLHLAFFYFAVFKKGKKRGLDILYYIYNIYIIYII